MQSQIIARGELAPDRSDPMPHLTVVDHAGGEIRIEAVPGLSLMEIIRNSGAEGLLALCGGCCSCATCHIYVESGVFDALTPMGADEDDMLDSSGSRTAASRLACQVTFDATLDGMRVTMAPED